MGEKKDNELVRCLFMWWLDYQEQAKLTAIYKEDVEPMNEALMLGSLILKVLLRQRGIESRNNWCLYTSTSQADKKNALVDTWESCIYYFNT